MSSPSSDGSNVIVIRDQPYGSFERNTLDIIYIPGDEPKRLVLLIHGGSWVAGDKQDVAFLVNHLLKQGMCMFQ
jgi:acetyl esterase/lipase